MTFKQSLFFLVASAFLSVAAGANSSPSLPSQKASIAKTLMETHCNLCHSPTAAELDGRIAPPLAALKAHYMDAFPKRTDFVTNWVDFVNNPQAKKVLAPGAVRRFGLMPKQSFPEGAVKLIAEFIFDYQIEEPQWLASHWQNSQGKKFQQSGQILANQEKPKSLSDVGLEYALETKKLLGQNLMTSIQQKGAIAAVEFCNEKAIPLTQEMAQKFNAKIRRASDRPRNPDNNASAEEVQMIAKFKKEISEKQNPTPVLVEQGELVHFYYPIQTNTMCLQCHGKNLAPEVQSRILSLYPKDKAVGYQEDEVRGIWSIVFKKKPDPASP